MLQLTDMRTRLERLLPFGWMVVGMVFLYLFWMLVARDLAWPPVGKAPEAVLPWLTGSEPKILAFYSAPVMVRGEPGTICYGVLNVKSVRLDPPVNRISPSLNRCIAVTPKETTVYTLYALGNDGRELTASFTVQVKPPPPAFLFVSVSAKEISRGDRYAICYGVKNAVSVKLKPAMGMPTPPVAKHCVMFYPPVSMEFKLTVTGEDGRTETLKPAVKVLSRKT